MSKFLVAIVEDDPRVSESLGGLLEAAGYAVLIYSSAEELLSGGRLPQIDCMVSDIGLPTMSGVDLMREVLAQRADLPVILVTGRHDAAYLAEMVKAGARHAFVKPVDTVALLNAIATLV